MRIVISGLSNSGKTTIFNALTGQNLETTAYPASVTRETVPHHGVINVPDERLERLSSIFKPKKTTHATIDLLDFPGIIPGDVTQNGKVFSLIKESDAVLHVVRAFKNQGVIHPSGDVNPLRDVVSFETEMLLGDLEFVEKRLERIDEQAKKGKRADEADRGFLLRCKRALEDEKPIRDIEFTDVERVLMSPYQFLTTIPEIIGLNIDEDDIDSERTRGFQIEIENYFKGKGRGALPPILSVCGMIEMEAYQIPDEERGVFLKEMGIGESAKDKFCRAAYDALGLITFFTFIKDEVRAWTIRNGDNALKAAGKVHSDIERGFIKAEVVSYGDFISSGGDMHIVRERGMLRLEGKNYIVNDGDIITFKFHV